MARPSKFTPERKEKILEAVRLGMTYRSAAALAGIDENTLGVWKKRYRDFEEDLRKADTDCKEQLLQQIRAAVPQDWRAGAWLLERHFPDEYSKRETHRQEGRVEQIVIIRRSDERESGDENENLSSSPP